MFHSLDWTKSEITIMTQQLWLFMCLFFFILLLKNVIKSEFSKFFDITPKCSQWLFHYCVNVCVNGWMLTCAVKCLYCYLSAVYFSCNKEMEKVLRTAVQLLVHELMHKAIWLCIISSIISFYFIFGITQNYKFPLWANNLTASIFIIQAWSHQVPSPTCSDSGVPGEPDMTVQSLTSWGTHVSLNFMHLLQETKAATLISKQVAVLLIKSVKSPVAEQLIFMPVLTLSLIKEPRWTHTVCVFKSMWAFCINVW